MLFLEYPRKWHAANGFVLKFKARTFIRQWDENGYFVFIGRRANRYVNFILRTNRELRKQQVVCHLSVISNLFKRKLDVYARYLNDIGFFQTASVTHTISKNGRTLQSAVSVVAKYWKNAIAGYFTKCDGLITKCDRTRALVFHYFMHKKRTDVMHQLGFFTTSQ